MNSIDTGSLLVTSILLNIPFWCAFFNRSSIKNVDPHLVVFSNLSLHFALTNISFSRIDLLILLTYEFKIRILIFKGLCFAIAVLMHKLSLWFAHEILGNSDDPKFILSVLLILSISCSSSSINFSCSTSSVTLASIIISSSDLQNDFHRCSIFLVHS